MSKARDGRTGARERHCQKSYIRLMSLFVDSLNSLAHSSAIFSSRLAFWMIVNHLSFPSTLIFALSAARALAARAYGSTGLELVNFHPAAGISR